MALLKIARMGHPVLATPAKRVSNPTSRTVARLVEDMIETMKDAGGVGLAAPQVHVPRRVVVIRISAARLAGEDGRGDDMDEGDDTVSEEVSTVLVNPTVEPLSAAQEEGWEACLSLPGMAGLVPRFTAIRVGYQTLDGRDVSFEAAGFYARVIQHECDHLDGILYPQRMTDLRRFGFAEEIQRAREAEALAEAADD